MKHSFISITVFYLFFTFTVEAQWLREFSIEPLPNERAVFPRACQQTNGLIVFKTDIEGITFEQSRATGVPRIIGEVIYDRQRREYVLCIPPTDRRYRLTIIHNDFSPIDHYVEEIVANQVLIFKIYDMTADIIAQEAETEKALAALLQEFAELEQAEAAQRQAEEAQGMERQRELQRLLEQQQTAEQMQLTEQQRQELNFEIARLREEERQAENRQREEAERLAQMQREIGNQRRQLEEMQRQAELRRQAQAQQRTEARRLEQEQRKIQAQMRNQIRRQNDPFYLEGRDQYAALTVNLGLPWTFGFGFLGRIGDFQGWGLNLNIGWDIGGGVVEREEYDTLGELTDGIMMPFHYSIAVKFFPYKNLFVSAGYGTHGIQKVESFNKENGNWDTGGYRQPRGLIFMGGVNAVGYTCFSVNAGVGYDWRTSNWTPMINVKFGIIL